jgi:general nucleoside transport system ATP-binding protein
VPALRLVDIAKRYQGVVAVRGVTVTFETGEIHAVVGENGAGKSTLLRIAAGVTTPDAGDVLIESRRLLPHTAREAIRRGVGMVQQHFALIPAFSVLENMVLGAETTRFGGRLDLATSRARAAKILTELGVVLPLDLQVERLGVGDRQRLEIARVLYRNARVLILDEPTAVLTPREAEALFGILRRLAISGRAVIVVTHKLDEVVTHADTVSVLRRGELITSRPLPPLGQRKDEIPLLAAAIMGGTVPSEPTRAPSSLGGPVLVVDEVTLGRALRGVSFEVRAGEVVGIAGIEGNGQRELVRVIAGLDRPDSGTVRPKPEVRIPEGGRRSGVRPAVVHEDRHHEGLVLQATLRDNLVLGELAHFTAMGLLQQAALDDEARLRCDKGGVQPHDLDLPAGALSGGNQQKLLIARALARVELGCPTLVVAHPTRGVDIGASRAIHAQILEAAARRRVAVLVISSDLGELRALCDRILVMAEGQIVADLAPTASDAQIGEPMLARAAAPGSSGSSGAFAAFPPGAE